MENQKNLEELKHLCEIAPDQVIAEWSIILTFKFLKNPIYKNRLKEFVKSIWLLMSSIKIVILAISFHAKLLYLISLTASLYLAVIPLFPWNIQDVLVYFQGFVVLLIWLHSLYRLIHEHL